MIAAVWVPFLLTNVVVAVEAQSQLVGEPKSPRAEPAPVEPPTVEFVDSEGRPLSSEQEREAREQLKKEPLPATRPARPSVTAPASTSVVDSEGGVVVTGQRPRGSVIGDIPATQRFSPLELRAYGANDIGELLQALAPQLGSIQGRGDGAPVVLLNGKRISSFAEIARIPTEAIERTEVFPEEVALKYGYRADQKVVNIVTYARYAAKVGQAGFSSATEGGRISVGGGANYLRLDGDTRTNVTLDYERAGAITERERHVTALVGSSDDGRFRTLVPETSRLMVNGVVSGPISKAITGTLNGRFEASEADSLLGFGFGRPIERDLDTRVGHLGVTLNGMLSRWQWTLTGNYDRARTETRTSGILSSVGEDKAVGVNTLADIDLVLAGSAFSLPAGPVSATLRLGAARRNFEGRSTGLFAQELGYSRDRGAVQLNLDVPLLGRKSEPSSGPTGIGNLSANVNVGAERLSDFGTLRTFGYGLTWSPSIKLNLIASVTREEGAPTLEQLSSPVVITPNIRTFDFARNEVVDIARVFGGNPGLVADDRRVMKLGASLKPVPETDLTISFDYVDTRIENPIVSFPISTPAVEAALPDRFVRDGSGVLRQVDVRPLNFERAERRQLRAGLNFARPLGQVPPGMEPGKARFVGNTSDIQSALPPGARVVMAEPGSAAMKGFENASSRVLLSLYYTLNIRDRFLVREGGPTLNLLDGAATDPRGGTARHSVQFQASAFKRGLGGRLAVNWQNGSVLGGLPMASGADRLKFSSLGTLNLTLFANFSKGAGGLKAPEWLSGTRLSAGIVNLLNARQRVRDATGATPLNYQPAYLDPIGRAFNVSLRKLF